MASTVVQQRVLVVDDDLPLRRALARALELEGYDVEVAADGVQALASFGAGFTPDALVLDVLMPNLDGLATCRTLRDRGESVPILMLTARQTVEDRVEGLDAGADDYLAKPFAVLELLARLRALMRRRGAEDDVLRHGDLELDPAERRAYRAGRRIELSRIEFALLTLFMSKPNRVLTRAAIFEEVWGYDMEYASNSLEVYVGYLRRKTEVGGASRLIHTIRGVGYVMRDGS